MNGKSARFRASRIRLTDHDVRFRSGAAEPFAGSVDQIGDVIAEVHWFVSAIGDRRPARSMTPRRAATLSGRFDPTAAAISGHAVRPPSS